MHPFLSERLYLSSKGQTIGDVLKVSLMEMGTLLFLNGKAQRAVWRSLGASNPRLMGNSHAC